MGCFLFLHHVVQLLYIVTQVKKLFVLYDITNEKFIINVLVTTNIIIIIFLYVRTIREKRKEDSI